MNFLLSGYYGFDNAGDEAVLAAILDELGARVPENTRFIVTSGDPANTVALHSTASRHVEAIPRQHPRALLQAMRACDVFISGGGSLIQDATSLRNVVYYTSLIRFARLLRKPVMIYAQGVGPLRQTLSQKLARAAMQGARVITVRDEDSKELLRRIGVTRKIEVTADPVWALQPGGMRDEEQSSRQPLRWNVSLRSWLDSATEDGGVEPVRRTIAILRTAASAVGARLRFLPMQPAKDRTLVEACGAQSDEIFETEVLHPRDVMAACGRCDVMIAMRLHALIFAAAQGVPCVAINYDPKVEALAKMIGAPMIQDASAGEFAKLPTAITAARPMAPQLLARLQEKARRNAELAAALAPD
ncbi:MAG: polysaccharide pyruvyl transferase CsaB [Armatimonadota bacterium]|nr:polysaccharide pyruvyl transferase CsaB [Armatimonadota bacterium]